MNSLFKQWNDITCNCIVYKIWRLGTLLHGLYVLAASSHFIWRDSNLHSSPMDKASHMLPVTWQYHPNTTTCIEHVMNVFCFSHGDSWCNIVVDPRIKWSIIYFDNLTKFNLQCTEVCMAALIYKATLDASGLPMWTRKYCPTVSSTVSIRSLSLSCCSNMMPDTSDSSLSVMALSVMDTSELAPDKNPRFLTLILSKLWSSSMTCLTGYMRKFNMSQRTHLGRSTAGWTILYLIKEMKPKIPQLSHYLSLLINSCTHRLRNY